MFLDNVHFLRPLWLLLLPVICLVWWKKHHNYHNQSIWKSVCDLQLLKLLLLDNSQSSKLFNQNSLITLASIIIVLALSGPAFYKTGDPLLRSNAALIIALDLSSSMLVKDIEPSRYARAKFKIEDLLNQHRKGDVALIVYAENAYPVTPLTHDVDNIKALIPSLTPQIMPGRGSDVYEVLKLSRELLDRSNLKQGELLLISDGINNSEVSELSDFANKVNLRISVLAVGTEQGGYIPARNGIDMLLDAEGSMIESKLDLQSLNSLADETDGLFQLIRIDAEDVNALSKFFNKADNQHKDSGDGTPDQWQDSGIIFLFLSLPFVVFLFRKNLLYLLVFSISISQHEPVYAFDITEYFMSADQKAKAAYDKNDFQTSLTLFTEKRWQAASAYRLDDWETALGLYEKLDDPESIYNRGNTLVFLARLEEAVAAYNEVLRLEPEHQDAKHNKAEVLKILDKLSREQQKNTRTENKDSKETQAQESNKENESNELAQNNAESQQKKTDQKESLNSSGDLDDVQTTAEATQRSDSDDANSAEASEQENEIKENILSEEQWLRRIKDDPAGLIRRKFREIYNQQNTTDDFKGNPW